eukprot:403348679
MSTYNRIGQTFQPEEDLLHNTLFYNSNSSQSQVPSKSFGFYGNNDTITQAQIDLLYSDNSLKSKQNRRKNDKLSQNYYNEMSETERLDYEIEQHFKMLEEQDQQFARDMKLDNKTSSNNQQQKSGQPIKKSKLTNSNSVKMKSFTQNVCEDQEPSEPSLYNENLMNYINIPKNQSTKPPTSSKLSKQQIGNQLLSEANFTDEKDKLLLTISELKRQLQPEGLPLFGNLFNPQNLNQSVGQTLNCIHSLLNYANQQKGEVTKGLEVQTRLQNENGNLNSRIESLQNVIKDLKDKLKGTRMDVKNITEKQISTKSTLKIQEKLKQQDMSKIEQRLAQMTHEIKKLQLEKSQLQDKIHKMLDMKSYQSGVIELNKIIFKDLTTSPVKKQMKTIQDLNKELVGIITENYEAQLLKLRTHHDQELNILNCKMDERDARIKELTKVCETQLECLNLFEETCTKFDDVRLRGQLQKYDGESVRKFVGLFQDIINQRLAQRVIVGGQGDDKDVFVDNDDDYEYNDIQDGNMQQEQQVNYEKEKWKNLFKQTGNTIIFE